MALSFSIHTYAGGVRTFPISFALGTGDRDNVAVYVIGELDGAGDQLYRTFTWNSDSEILVTDTITVGAQVRIQRTVSKTTLVADYTQPGSATRENLQATATQAMMAIHEFVDGRVDSLPSDHPSFVALAAAQAAAADAIASAAATAEDTVEAAASAAAAATAAAAAVPAASTAVSAASAAETSALTAATLANSAAASAAAAATAAAAAVPAASTAVSAASAADAAAAEAVVSADRAEAAVVWTNWKAFLDRATLVTHIAYSGAVAGTRYTDGRVDYVTIPVGHALYGTNPITDLPGLMWFGFMSVRHFGATGDEVTDDAPAINLAFDFLRRPLVDAEFVTSSTSNGTLTGEHLKYRCNSSINATGINTGTGKRVENMLILSNAGGKVALDVVGSNSITWTGVKVAGLNQFNTAMWPRVGWQFARTTTAGATECWGHVLIDCGTEGFFQQSAYVNYGAELMYHYGCFWINRGNPEYGDAIGLDCLAGIMQATNVYPVTSEYHTVVTGQQSNTAQFHYGCRFQKPYGTPGPTMAFQGIWNHHYHNMYITNGNGSMIKWHILPNQLDWNCTLDIQSETAGSDNIIAFIGTDAAATHTVSDLKLRCGNIFASTSILSANGIARINMNAFDLSVPTMQYAGLPASGIVSNKDKFAMRGVNMVLPSMPTSEFVNYLEFSGTVLARDTGKSYHVGGVEHAGRNFQSVANDTAFSIPAPTTHGYIEFFTSSASAGGRVNYRADATPVVTHSSVASGIATANNVVLTGTTGAANKITVSITNGVLYIENRFGYTVTIWWRLGGG